MRLYSFEGRRPRLHADAFIAPTATLIGDVTVEAGAYQALARRHLAGLQPIAE